MWARSDPEDMDPLIYASLMRGPISNAIWPGVESARFWQAAPSDVDEDSLDLSRFSMPTPQRPNTFIRDLVVADLAKRITADDAKRCPFLVGNGHERLRHKRAPITCAPRQNNGLAVVQVALAGQKPTVLRTGSRVNLQ
jgi:hypothetical protein